MHMFVLTVAKVHWFDIPMTAANAISMTILVGFCRTIAELAAHQQLQ